MSSAVVPPSTDVLVVGAGPAGSAAAAWAARAGRDVVLADAAVFPRDKACGDGLTPRAIAELDRLGLGEWARSRARNRGLRAAGFGREWELPWPGGEFPDHGSAVPRTELDARIRACALEAGAAPLEGARAVDVERDGDRVTGVVLELGRRAGDRRLRAAGRRRRRPVPAGPAAGPRVAPRHRLRRGRPRLPALRAGPTTSGSPRTSSCAAPSRGAAVRLRLGVPARRRRRRGQHRRGDAGHGAPSRPACSCVRCWTPTPPPAARTGSWTGPCGRPRRRCCRWAAPSPASPAGTGR